jgi:hypothetical protein
MTVHHVRAHAHDDARPAGTHGSETHAERLTSTVALEERCRGAFRTLLGSRLPFSGIAHVDSRYQWPLKRGARFSLKALTPSA